jgi:hypothetical protein
MRYLIAMLCPPLAMAWSGRPRQAILAVLTLVVAAATWSSGVGVLLVAFTMLWGCRIAGEHYADEELEGFLHLMQSTKSNQL